MVAGAAAAIRTTMVAGAAVLTLLNGCYMVAGAAILTTTMVAGVAAAAAGAIGRGGLGRVHAARAAPRWPASTVLE